MQKIAQPFFGLGVFLFPAQCGKNKFFYCTAEPPTTVIVPLLKDSANDCPTNPVQRSSNVTAACESGLYPPLKLTGIISTILGAAVAVVFAISDTPASSTTSLQDTPRVPATWAFT